MYLGLPVGGDSRRLAFWEPIMSRIAARLSGWKSRFLSFGGRLILIKYVMSSLPVYAISFFKAPTCIISSIESLFNKFFWGGSEDHRKISWISWNKICVSKEVGGLGVRRMREFNLALLGKWCWRMLVEREGLWYRVLVACYGQEGGMVREGGRCSSTWWRDVASIRDRGGGVGGGWFKDNVFKKVGNGMDTYFWTDPWIGGIPLAVRFSRLFELSVVKNSRWGLCCLWMWRKVGVRGSGGGGCGCGRRTCYESVGCCCLMLFCRFKVLIDGGGALIPMVSTLSVLFTICLPLTIVGSWMRL